VAGGLDRDAGEEDFAICAVGEFDYRRYRDFCQRSSFVAVMRELDAGRLDRLRGTCLERESIAVAYGLCDLCRRITRAGLVERICAPSAV
jgi:hypothetical protein